MFELVLILINDLLGIFQKPWQGVTLLCEKVATIELCASRV